MYRFVSNSYSFQRRVLLKRKALIHFYSCSNLEHGVRTSGASLPKRISVHIDDDVCNHAQIRHKFNRALLPDSMNCIEHTTVESLRKVVEKHIPQISGESYDMRYYVGAASRGITFRLSNEDDMKEAIGRARNSLCFVLLIQSRAGIFPPIDASTAYLEGLPDPYDSNSYTMLSFYDYTNVSDPQVLADQLVDLWRPFRALGRVYVASEGINAQMAIPSNVYDVFKIACATIPELDKVRMNTDHNVISREDFTTIYNYPFKVLHVRVKNFIVADGLKDSNISVNPQENTGTEVSPLDWNSALAKENAVILDCRNDFESKLGKFDGAIPLNTVAFNDTFDILDDVLKDTPKDTPILAYCTGGIRCVKVGAYLEQRMGFSDVSRLKGGIVAYVRELKCEAGRPSSITSTTGTTNVDNPNEIKTNNFMSKFRGLHYVFDGRVTEKVTDEVLAECDTCHRPWDVIVNCHNCNTRIIRCPGCVTTHSGCCSAACRESVQLKGISKAALCRPTNDRKPSQGKKIRSFSTLGTSEGAAMSDGGYDYVDSVEEYCKRYSDPEPDWLTHIRTNTCSVYPHVGAQRMLCSPLQGRLLASLVSIANGRSILELGTFTGYSIACLAEGVYGKTPSASDSSGQIITCDPDEKAIFLAQQHLNQSPYKNKVDFRNEKADKLLRSLQDSRLQLDDTGRCTRNNGTFDFVFIDADKNNCALYLELLLGVRSSHTTDSTEGTETEDRNSRSLLKPNAVVVLDNTLWKGLVLKHEQDLQMHVPPATNAKETRNSDIKSLSFHKLNQRLVECSSGADDSRANVVDFTAYFQTVMLPLRDGLTLLRYTGGST